jgi:hypothetical protein
MVKSWRKEQMTCPQKLDELPELGINETGSVTRLGYWVLGRDMLGDDAFNNFWPTAQVLAEQRGEKPPDWRDLDHLHAHYMLEESDITDLKEPGYQDTRSADTLILSFIISISPGSVSGIIISASVVFSEKPPTYNCLICSSDNE